MSDQRRTSDRRELILADTAGESGATFTLPAPEPDNTAARQDIIDFDAAADHIPGGSSGVRRLAEIFKAECQSLMKTLRSGHGYVFRTVLVRRIGHQQPVLTPRR